MPENRYLQAAVTADLAAKMVFVASPRQVGKTTLDTAVLEQWSDGLYLNWDSRDDRRDIRAARWPAGRSLVVLDELHKWRAWKRWLKGEYDAHRARTQFLVTGSARLDVYRKGGDSLQGRYHHYRLHPFSLGEVMRKGRPATIDPGGELPLARASTEAGSNGPYVDSGGRKYRLLSAAQGDHQGAGEQQGSAHGQGL